MHHRNHGVFFVATIALAAAAVASEPPSAPTDSPLGGGGSRELEPTAPRESPGSSQRQRRQVYVCQDEGIATFADRPCSAQPERRQLLVLSPPPGEPPSTAPRPAAASTRPRPVPVAAERPAPAGDDRCGALRNQLERIDDQMRAGYSAREAARLWNRWRDTRAQLRARRC